MPVDFIHTFLSHDAWATTNLLITCEPLTDEQLHRPFEMGPGSLHAVVTHVIGSMRFWEDILAGREPRPRIEQDGQPRTVAALRALHAETAADFARVAHAHDSGEVITVIRRGTAHRFTRGGIVAHVATHGMHHRAQALNMLRHLNVPLPLSSVAEWMTASQPAASA